jgi:molecular chaperone GrpE
MTEKETPAPASADEPIESEVNTPEALDQDLTELYEHVQKAIDERDSLKDQLLRTMADFQNYRKRVQDEKRQIEERANERFVVGLLPVLDNFERGIAAAENGGSLESVVEGIKAVERQLKSVLESQKVVRVASLGKPFDPDLHEALAAVEVGDKPEGTIVDEIEAGYKLGDRVIRPARVRVSKKP